MINRYLKHLSLSMQGMLYPVIVELVELLDSASMTLLWSYDGINDNGDPVRCRFVDLSFGEFEPVPAPCWCVDLLLRSMRSDYIVWYDSKSPRFGNMTRIGDLVQW